MWPHQQQQQQEQQTWSRELHSDSQGPPPHPPRPLDTSTHSFQAPSYPRFPSALPPPSALCSRAAEPFPSTSSSFEPHQRRHRQYSHPDSLPLGSFESPQYPASFAPPPPPLAFPSHHNGGHHSQPSVPSNDPTAADLYTLRSLQRQRKREYSNSTGSTSSSVIQARQEHNDARTSSLMGFAGGGGGGASSESQHLYYPTREESFSGRSTPVTASSTRSSFSQQQQQAPMEYSTDPSPPMYRGAGPHYDYFAQTSTRSSISSSEYSLIPMNEEPSTSSSNILPNPPSHQYQLDHRRPQRTTNSNFSFFVPSNPLPHPSTSNSTLSLPRPPPPFVAPSTARGSIPSLTRPPLSLSTTTNPNPIEEPPSDPDSINSSTSLTNAKLLPILERGLKIRIKHYEELPNPLGVVHPARGNRSKKNESQGSSRSREGEQDQGEGEEEETAKGWSGREWKIGKNASGKKIVAFEIKVNCRKCRAMGSTSSGSNEEGQDGEQTEERKDRKVARIVLRNLSQRLLEALSGIDQRVQAEEDQTRGLTDRTARSRSSTTNDSNDSSFPASSGSSSTATARNHSSSTTPTPSDDPNSTTTTMTILEELGIGLSGSSCLVCAGLASLPTSATELPSTNPPSAFSAAAQQVRERGYEDTLSAAIDRFEKLKLTNTSSTTTTTKEKEGLDGGNEDNDSQTKKDGKKREEKNQEEVVVRKGKSWEKLVHLEESQIAESGDYQQQDLLKCDVCNLVCGVSTIDYDDPLPTLPSLSTSKKKATNTSRAFTVEIICARCDALFKACSDCGGGGGRLTPGKWRCKELFPDGRKNCQLSHARNPTLNEITIVVSQVSALSPAELDEASAACRKLFFNTRLGTLCRPDFMLKGDGLAKSFQQAENLSIDYWGRLEDVLRCDLSPDSPMKRYLCITYSQPRPRHPPKAQQATKSTVKEEEEDADFDDEFDLGEPRPAPPKPRQTKGGGRKEQGKTVPWAFSIVEVDFSVGTLFFCCVIPWATSGQSFDANSLLIERTNERVKSDLAALNAGRQAQGLAPFPRLKYNFIVSPFRLDSKNSQNLNRRGFYTLDQLEEIEEEGVNRRLFPPFRQIWLPAHYAKAMHTFVRKLENEQDMGGPPPQNAPRKRKKKTTTAL
ncbi:uncharacterized protein JCM6883_004526 [Sporobolomyces salmoneus]|uniref:uncharacterized protein n=1 Tax=Sporobolomyces salmoneus TaxID=183962 RepID=UPI003178633D